MSTTIDAANAATETALAARRADAAKDAKPTAVRKPRAPRKPATPPPPPVTGRRARTPKERAALPVTATIAAYVEWLNREIYGGKMTKDAKAIAGVSITLYGAYQISPERRAARGAK